MKGLLQIHDPQKPRGQAIGIDLGTTHSLVAAVVSGKPECIIVDQDDSLLLPSVVNYASNGSVLVGQQALAQIVSSPSDTIRSIKRLMGRSPSEITSAEIAPYRLHPSKGIVRLEVAGGHPVTPIEVSGEILRTLKRRAEVRFSSKIDQAVITVPAYFDDAQRQATKDAARLAGIEVLRLLNEPTAAALAYGLEKSAQGLYAIYDLGGGTFDISILELIDGVFQVKSVGGNSALGGDDFDRAIVDHLLQLWQVAQPTAAQTAALRLEARHLKEQLTLSEEVTIQFNDLTATLKRAKFEALISQLVEKTGAAVRRALKDAGLVASDVKGVVLVGGSTRVPAVKRYVAELFGQEPLADIDPDRVVALGAAISADLLTNESRQDEILLLDVIQLSLGLETKGGVVEKLIEPNSTIPTTRSQSFTTFQDGQTGMDFHVVQGERELVSDCRSLSHFRLSGIPSMAAGMARIEVEFHVNADGILAVKAKELSTGIEQGITVKPSHGLTDEEIEQMLLDSIDHAEDDIQNRQLAEQRVEADRILLDARKQLRENGALLDDAEREALKRAMAQVENLALTTSDHEQLKHAIMSLDTQARPFVERIMNRAIAQAAVGHRMEDF